MTFAAPGFLVAAFAVAAAAVALHLLVLRPPPASQLPTARFVPPAPSMVRRRETWPQDRALLALRVATILLAGLAFAGPAFSARRSLDTRIVAADQSAPAARDSVGRYLRPSDVLIPFDRSLSEALVAARRAAAHLRAKSLELVVISPFARSSVDAATPALRAQWPAAIRAVRVVAPPAPPVPVRVTWVPPVGAIDTVGGVFMEGLVAVAPFTRARGDRVMGGTVVAWWVDGQPAAVERPLIVGCEREAAIGIPATRDGERLRAALADRPCGDAWPSQPMSDSAVRAFAGSGSLGAVVGPSRDGDPTLMTVLLLLAGALAIVEWVVRR